jgi:hypothetical protein
MFAQQWIGQLVVIKAIFGEAVTTIVAGPAVCAKIRHMHRHVVGLIVAMAALAHGGGKTGQLLAVAVYTAERLLRGGRLVGGQTEPELLVVNNKCLHLGQRRCRSPVFDVTVATVLLFQHPVQRGWVGHCGLNIGVARQAAVGHALAAPRRCMAGGTVSAEGGVRIHATEGCAAGAGRFEWPWVKHPVTIDEEDAGHSDKRHYGHYYAKRWKTAGQLHYAPP